MTTDSYVVDPVFFPGGNIGSLAVHGTVNDLSMQGAVPAFLTLGMILEEGLPLEDLARILDAAAEAAARPAWPWWREIPRWFPGVMRTASLSTLQGSAGSRRGWTWVRAMLIPEMWS